ncbi:DNA topoisomerase 1 [Candidatus Profftia lariciata]|uniref:type I DNA topoisomerase n=1 Tax=Candidatus Profftia lariciata TaxID=1987921 RepID=UPI001D026F07|nr:type I DNA topoisomerase [Candidatus Profftia lariciata]UDG81668.1 DNA topoisomerase 1 [Candidatus Profftia lariciata]
MSTSLVIVESPAKAKTISQYLGKNYVVKSSVGHIRDLPTSRLASKREILSTKNKEKNKIHQNKHEILIKRMGIDPYQEWTASYEILPGKEQIVAELKSLAKTVDHIYLATDLDREGEAIAWHLREVIGGDENRYSRVVFNEITQKAIQQAFNKPGKLNINRVYAQQTRRFMDRIVGYMISPLLWKKIARGLSAGRVQSVAVRLIVDREHDIKTFSPEEYWELRANLNVNNIFLQMQVTNYKNKIFKPINNQDTHAAIEDLEKAKYIVFDRVDKLTNSNPRAPFITSTLQQTANTRLNFSVKKTMMLAQLLYEAGHITYMRTDSKNLSQDALNMVRNYINQLFGKQYLPKKPNTYAQVQNSQEAHEAIRPTNIYMISEYLNNMGDDAQKLYNLIWLQFVSCQMTSAKYNFTTIYVKAGDYILQTKRRTVYFDGWTKIIPQVCKEIEDDTLPFIKVGTHLIMQQLLPLQRFTKPPVRFNEASLVRELEKRSIGRPSTYASIISTIQDRGYVRIKHRCFYAEKIGEIVTYSLKNNFPELINYDFTAHMEDDLDQVANANKDWKILLDNFFQNFSQQLFIAENDPKDGGMRTNHMVKTNILCPTCQRQMGIRIASTGIFLGCSGYKITQKEKRCKTTINLIPEEEVVEGDSVKTSSLLDIQKKCLHCGTTMDGYLIDNHRKLYICGNNPNCEGYEIIKGNFLIKGYHGPIVECKQCQSQMQVKIGRFGKYMACINQDCKNTCKILRNGNLAPQKESPIPLPELPCKKSDAYFILRDGTVGIFLAANTFPKSRETRAPLVEELARFKERLPKKFHYIANAPQKDPKGNKTIVRFNRKTKEQYIASESNGKATGWTAFFTGGKWIEN